MDFYIVNEVDRPCEQHIAEMRGDGKMYYIHPELKDNTAYHGMSADRITNLKDFGIEVKIEGNLFSGIQSGPSVAKYHRDSDRIRQWQGRGKFSFRVGK